MSDVAAHAIDASGLTSGFEVVHAEERAKLGLASIQTLDGVGLALSGGGIRSASFALGVVQMLINSSLLQRFDYLSTVSGGGYLGSSLSWWLHQCAPPTAADPPSPDAGEQKRSPYQAFKEQFGSKVKGARAAPGSSSASNWLAFIRQHGNYLQPPGVGWLSLAATVLRVCLSSLMVYFAAVVGLFSLLIYCWGTEAIALIGAALSISAAAVIIAWTITYGPATWVVSSYPQVMSSNSLYEKRTWFRVWSGNILTVALAGLILWSVPQIASVLQESRQRLVSFALSSTGLGLLGSIYQFWRGRANTAPSIAGALRIIVTAALVLYGLLLLAYFIPAYLVPAYLGQDGMGRYRHVVGCVAVVTGLLSALFGCFVNVNSAGIARLYRDRLMEAFLPNPASSQRNTWGLATLADEQTVASLAGRLDRDGSLNRVEEHSNCQRPLHILNCNVVLMNSKEDIYRTRGGDCFAITNLWSGGNATRWIRTPKLGDGQMTLATAMAISGAAANPNAAPNGQGVERNSIVAFLMTLFNARLGFWIANPSRLNRNAENRPNYWVPGLRQGLLGSGLQENAGYLELTDGGHFDNTGVYELIRRRTRLIVLCEAGQDPDLSMDDLANLIEKVRVDFSVFIEFKDPALNVRGLRPPAAQGRGQCERGYAIGRVRYPKGSPTSPEFEDGLIVYLQAVPIASMPTDVDSYWLRNLHFPNDTTADQFFDEDNLEAYRELGYAIASQFYGELKSVVPGNGDLSKVADILRR
jgi:hypothetical protein